ncbi:MAG: type II toxin-antitoxin system VapC family toxin [Actinomycetota bacterium]|nr:type II toxin-antitoxin system VapC family toxin [Actinomycetota bacterium]
MAVCYFDSSALVKMLLDESESDLARSLWSGADLVLTSVVAYAEVRAALAMASRLERLTESDHVRAKAYWERMWESISTVEATRDVVERAGSLAERHQLRGFDAVHLASASVVASTLLIVATWDEQLSDAAAAMGYSVAPR